MRRLIATVVTLCLVSLLLVAPAAAGGGCHSPTDTEPTSRSGGAALIGECSYMPTVTFIEPGDTVTWTNKDAVPHTVTGAHLSWGDETLMSRGDEVSYTFEDEGVYPYYCLLHPGMVGAVVVGNPGAAGAATGTVKTDASSGAASADASSAAASSAAAEGEPAEVEAEASPGWLIPAALAGIGALLFVAAIPLRRKVSAIP